MCISKSVEESMNCKGTVDVDLPAGFCEQLWRDVANQEAKEARLRGIKPQQIIPGEDGEFHVVGKEE